MAEKTCIPSSQESLPLSEETCLLLLNDLGDSFSLLMDDDATTLQVGSITNCHEDLKEKSSEEELIEISQALSVEVAKSNHLSKVNAEMNSEINNLREILMEEEKAKLEIEQNKLVMENILREKEMKINDLQQQLTRSAEELYQTRLKCYEEAAAKGEALQKLHDIERQFYNIRDFDRKGVTQAQNLNEVNEEHIEDSSNSQLQTEFLTNTFLKTRASLPATESWPGGFGFNVSFAMEDNVKAQWIYSASKNKLYVKKDAPCPINFSANTLLDNSVIRIMPFFSSADNVLDLVHRCVNHSMMEINEQKPEAEHLVRVQSIHAQYETNQSGRHSVVVPYENPQAGQQFSRYIMKFACFQSCSGGPNRRPLMLVFTLERRGVVVGRQRVHLKICACPLRDFKLDEKPSSDSSDKSSESVKKGVKRQEPWVSENNDKSLLNSSENQTKKKCLKREQEDAFDTLPLQTGRPFRNYDMPVKIRPSGPPYYVKVDDLKIYECLKLLSKVLKVDHMPLTRRTLINLFNTYSSSGSEEEERK